MHCSKLSDVFTRKASSSLPAIMAITVFAWIWRASGIIIELRYAQVCLSGTALTGIPQCGAWIGSSVSRSSC